MSGMQPIKPEDKPKVIALGAATAIMFGYVGVSFARSHSNTPAPTASPSPLPVASTATTATPPPGEALPGSATPQQANAMTQGTPAALAGMSAEAAAGAARQKVVMPDLRNDPFRPTVSSKALDAKPDAQVTMLPQPLGVKKEAAKSAAPAAKPLKDESLGFTLPTIVRNGAGLPGVAGTVAPMNPAGLPVTPVELPLKLNGVITGGAGNVALVAVGDGEQFVSAGDVITRWHVLRIGPDTVTLRRGNQVRVLRVGSNSSDAVPVGTQAAVQKPAQAPMYVMPYPQMMPTMMPMMVTPQASPTPTAMPPQTAPVVPQAVPASYPVPVTAPAPAAPAAPASGGQQVPVPTGTPVPVAG